VKGKTTLLLDHNLVDIAKVFNGKEVFLEGATKHVTV
jgi:hypothetical protein